MSNGCPKLLGLIGLVRRCWDKQKKTNFGEVFIVDRVVCGKSDGNIKDAEGQA